MKPVVLASIIAFGAMGLALEAYQVLALKDPLEHVFVAQAATLRTTPKTLSGTFRCWHYNVGGRGARCSSATFVFNSNGKYSFSSERGTYVVNGSIVTLSGSKIRGPGTLSKDGLQLRFHYTYKGLETSVTYLKR